MFAISLAYSIVFGVDRVLQAEQDKLSQNQDLLDGQWELSAYC